MNKSPRMNTHKKRRSSKEKLVESEYVADEMYAQQFSKKKTYVNAPADGSHYAMGGDGGDDDGDHHNDGPSGTESDNSESGSEHSRESSDEDETSDYEGAAEDVPPPPPGHGLVRSESVRRKKQADEIIDSFIDDDDDLELLEARLKIMKAKKKANNIFTVSEEEFGNVQDRLESAMKYAVRNEVWNLITKGHHLQLRRELLKDKVSRNECIDHFFRVNNVSHRMSRMASAAAKSAIDYARDEDLLREEATGNFVRTGNFRSTPRKDPNKAKMEQMSPTRETRGRKRHQSPVAQDIEDEPLHTPTKHDSKKKKHRSKSKSRSPHSSQHKTYHQ